jgi:putative protein-disulfide isomerase
MKQISLLFLFTASTGLLSAQTNNMKPPSAPLLCDPLTGVCEMPGHTAAKPALPATNTRQKPLRIVYFTDPICSSCWGIEPQLRRLKLEYGSLFDIEYHMGGLLPDWSYNSGGISKPSDVARHWDEVSSHYQMPIDGDVWLEDPLDSSYPPSIAFKAAQMQDDQKAVHFLRLLREMVFLEKKNITRWQHISRAAHLARLDTTQLQHDFEGRAREAFQSDLQLARNSGVRGFPSVFIVDAQGQQQFIYGVRPYDAYTQAILQLHSGARPGIYSKDWHSLFHHYPTLTAREYAVLSGQSYQNALQELQLLTQQNKLLVLDTKNGSLWKLSDTH